jgi:transposase-like protein
MAKEFAMKRKRFSVEQIVVVLKQAELGLSVAELTRQVGISEQTFYRWKKQYGGLQSDQVRELKVLQDLRLHPSPAYTARFSPFSGGTGSLWLLDNAHEFR